MIVLLLMKLKNKIIHNHYSLIWLGVVNIMEKYCDTKVLHY